MGIREIITCAAGVGEVITYLSKNRKYRFGFDFSSLSYWTVFVEKGCTKNKKNLGNRKLGV